MKRSIWRAPARRDLRGPGAGSAGPGLGKRLEAGLGALVAAALAIPAAAQPAPEPVSRDISEICGPGGCTWESVAQCDGFLEGINFDAEGTLWVLGYQAGYVYRVEDGACQQIGEAQGGPNGAKFGPDGTFYVTDRWNGLQSVDLETGDRETLFRDHEGAHYRGLNDLAVDSMGGIYFTEPYGSDVLNRVGRVFYLAPDEGAVPEILAQGFAYPNGIMVSPDDERVYVSESMTNSVIAVPSPHATNPYDAPFMFSRLDGGWGPDGLTVDAQGNLYIAHFLAGEVVVVDRDGFPYGRIRIPTAKGMGQLAGMGVTNLAIHDGYLYVTEGFESRIWRVAIEKEALDRFGTAE